MPAESFRAQRSIALAPFGSVQGVDRTPPNGAARTLVQLTADFAWHQQGLHVFWSVRPTQPDSGAFSFEKVPAGRYQIFRYPAASPGNLPVLSIQKAVEVRPGETSVVDLKGSGSGDN
jgi:hypothetical protein